MYDDDPTLVRRLKAKDRTIADLLMALKVAKDSAEWMADAIDADPEDIERLEIVNKAIRKAGG